MCRVCICLFVGNVRLLLYLSYHVIPFIPSRKAALVSPATAVQLPGNSNDDDGVDPLSFTNDSTSNHRIDVVHAIIVGNADVDTELRFKIMKILFKVAHFFLQNKFLFLFQQFDNDELLSPTAIEFKVKGKHNNGKVMWMACMVAVFKHQNRKLPRRCKKWRVLYRVLVRIQY